MKTICTILTAFFLSFTIGIYGQEFIGNTAKLSKFKDTTAAVFYSANEICLIKLNDQTDEFIFNLPLFNILSSSTNDSITALNKLVFASYRADFPVSNLDFFSSGAEASFDITGELTINGITKHAPLHLSLQSAPILENNRDIHSYPVKISFAMDINPAEYFLDYETINFTRTITIEVSHGVINRTNDNTILK